MLRSCSGCNPCALPVCTEAGVKMSSEVTLYLQQRQGPRSLPLSKWPAVHSTGAVKTLFLTAVSGVTRSPGIAARGPPVLPSSPGVVRILLGSYQDYICSFGSLLPS